MKIVIDEMHATHQFNNNDPSVKMVSMIWEFIIAWDMNLHSQADRATNVPATYIF